MYLCINEYTNNKYIRISIYKYIVQCAYNSTLVKQQIYFEVDGIIIKIAQGVVIEEMCYCLKRHLHEHLTILENS